MNINAFPEYQLMTEAATPSRHVNPDGSLGGEVASTAQLGSAVVKDHAHITHATISGNAKIEGTAFVFGNLTIDGISVIGGRSRIIAEK